MPKLAEPVGRFHERVEKTASGCWLWTGALNGTGYGSHQNMMAHRYSWITFRGPIPAGLQVCHTCDVRQCVNPDHLFLGTQRDNLDDMWAKRRGPKVKASLKGEINPRSKLTEGQVLEIRAKYDGSRSSRDALALEYGINRTQIMKIVLGRAWKHLAANTNTERLAIKLNNG